ncbi:hypothetical protein F4808DRAFT_296763 [Astrocystis sublimbata]|nr:hypothetical protein F4808DRAFT_296763 [Astrocystis sublimbata]
MLVCHLSALIWGAFTIPCHCPWRRSEPDYACCWRGSGRGRNLVTFSTCGLSLRSVVHEICCKALFHYGLGTCRVIQYDWGSIIPQST